MNAFGKLRFRTKLLITYLLLVMLPLASLGAIFYFVSLDRISDISSKNTLEIIRKTNEIADFRFQKVRESGLELATDKDFFQIMENLDPNRGSDILSADRRLSALLNKYFLSNEDLYSFQLVTSYYVFGNYKPRGSAYDSEMYRKAVAAGGRMQWIPTYHYERMYRQNGAATADSDDPSLFSAVMQMNGFYIENGFQGNGVAHFWNGSVEPPVLVVNYKEDYFRSLFEHSIPLEGFSYYVVSPDGIVVSHDKGRELGRTIGDPWIKDILAQKSGTAKVKIDGATRIVCFDTSAVTGWTSIVVIPPKELIRTIAPVIRDSAIFIGIVLFAVSFLLAYFFSGQIARPIKKLLDAIRRVGNGNFTERIDLDKDRDFGIVITKFNDMNDKIRQLIRENYESKLREKEAEIMSLNVQLNPHFLYNTLNIMNWMAIENDQKQLSKMLVSLSSMLHYTTHNFKETGDLQEELEWLRHYLYIMGERFDGKFKVYFDIADELYAYRVPRLFLHPIVENAILHGFSSLAKGGIITIAGRLEEGDRLFTVTDNGRGMDPAKLEQMLAPDSEHVGLKNVDTRIKLLYGPEYGLRIRSTPGQGTEAAVRLPGEIAKDRPPYPKKV